MAKDLDNRWINDADGEARIPDVCRPQDTILSADMALELAATGMPEATYFLSRIADTANTVSNLAQGTLNGSANGSNGQKITPQPNEAGLPGKRFNRDAKGRIPKLSAPAAARRSST